MSPCCRPRIDVDLAKDRKNRAKHGLGLARAADVDWDSALIWVDTRRDYGEKRQVALAPLGDRLCHVVFVEGQGVLRIISLRRANKREYDRYVKAIEATDGS